MGIEEAYDDTLSGKNGSRSYEKNSAFGDVKPGSVKEKNVLMEVMSIQH